MDDHDLYFPDRCVECPALLSEDTSGRCVECMWGERLLYGGRIGGGFSDAAPSWKAALNLQRLIAG